MEVTVEIPVSGEVTIKAIDLVGDAWHDFLHYMAEARQAETTNDLQTMNRALRTALGYLIGHLDGVVTGLCEEAKQSRNGFVVPQGRNGANCSLKSNILYLKNYAANRMGKRLPYLRLDLKPLRDILVHPSITKQHYNTDLGVSIQLSQKDLFELTVDELYKEGKHISNWLDNLCLAYSYVRVHDTEKICADLSASLGEAIRTNRL